MSLGYIKQYQYPLPSTSVSGNTVMYIPIENNPKKVGISINEKDLMYLDATQNGFHF